MDETPEQPMVEVVLGRIVIREGSDRQYIFLHERGGKRGFPIVIGSNEAAEIKRVIAQIECERPLTHQLAFSVIEASPGGNVYAGYLSIAASEARRDSSW